MEPSPISLTAIVLAGGQSSRMGTDKALLSIDNQPLLYRVCQLAQVCATQVLVVTPWLEKYQEVVPPGCRLVRETRSHGPLVGFARGLAFVDTEWVLLLACDLPCLPESELLKWLDYLDSVSAEAVALLPRHPQGWEPLAGFYRRSCLPQINDFVNQGGKSFQKWLKANYVQELPVTDPKMLFNCNTPADFQVAQRLVRPSLIN
ncbi:molybdenum cofactor guanylyltransferase [Oscillatoria salina]|uniref:molybdenum cofactor guanylyltransferase n=1 Tax=Oscillatoria salina TaxID=331517 RepID=UPI0013B7FAA4|nr:molybdenum cofactor guanylyltransferase [Oscillatoria salina]MBZ8180629.1 molybdenum cofactor guanylyltransferase [Oscillatoria salina IIICB1]NET88429.1 molybdenum cofactor guanylyltransferase [Kamptonema sp. SIO1D9]